MLLKKSWKFFGNCTKLLFKVLFPKAEWLATPKSNHILSFYKILNKTKQFALRKVKYFIAKFPTITIYKNLKDFFEHLIPFIFTYHKAMKKKNFHLLESLQPK